MNPAKGTILAVLFTLATAGMASADVVDVATEAGIAETYRTFSVTPGDYNKDSDDDFLLVRHIGNEGQTNVPESTLYAGSGTQFVNAFTSEFGKTDKHGCDWGDAASPGTPSGPDGRPDLFCTVGFTQLSRNELWVQRNDGTFVNRARALGLHAEPQHGRYRYGTFIDANGDNRLDIYAARYTGSCFCDSNGDGVVDYAGDTYPNELWLQEGDGTFRHAPEFGLDQPIGAKKDNATCAQAVDYDGDGDQDLLVCGLKHLKLYQNEDNTAFTDVTGAKGIKGNASDARLVDLNGDALMDFVKLTASALTVRYGNGAGSFGPVATLTTTSAGEALAFGRFDEGPTLDIYALSGRVRSGAEQPDQILLNSGTGAFTIERIPGAKGEGDDVAAIDYNEDDRDDFVVTNGDKTRFGPVQLFTWREPAP